MGEVVEAEPPAPPPNVEAAPTPPRLEPKLGAGLALEDHSEPNDQAEADIGESYALAACDEANRDDNRRPTALGEVDDDGGDQRFSDAPDEIPDDGMWARWLERRREIAAAADEEIPF